ncbi:bifunctional helix-turn-helix transcriptional regulator/GNAT family N-acetyltransferase [Fulvivirga maritima]|uniref:bifunctional helix-turn-helix transcriptional regulator/GNAT family N-acetyltransferase n=1 Tax=Fulvivirga maritima TaxID=2904247 RepID=UPI001F3245E1|nr:bifunctional helix-turn-helix transcriptional regulator/GNAT family N-acetyltransferase [Fulvivirga maritima]UII27477.1 bifunctional helix-turn-helix transcriptional regulator/GNAT family N-acetyltransferase [Fulvivirga maritima]
MEFFNEVGKMAIGSRLRLLTEKITTDAAEVYQLYGIDLQPKWFPVFYILSKGEAKSITGISKEIGHSHPSVSKIVREMCKAGLIKEEKDESDGRRNVVSLSKKAIEINEKLKSQLEDVNNAVEDIMSQTQNNLWHAIEEWEYLLGQKPLLRRVLEQKKLRESKEVEVVDYQPKYREAFKALNEEWISRYFRLETQDIKSLEDPEGYIIANGGAILVALYKGEPLGVCALVKMNDDTYEYELAKMAVSPKAQGKGLGFILGNAIKERAKSLGSSNLYLESNTTLKAAISLYEKLGFKKVAGRNTPYERANIQMAMEL